MRTLGEQWVEIIDGQKHMVKCVSIDHVESIQVDYYSNGLLIKTVAVIQDIYTSYERFTLKDLGILNASGFLPIPFDIPDGYPKYPVINEYSRNSDSIPELFQVSYSHMNCHINFGIYNTEQQAKDAWNRRA